MFHKNKLWQLQPEAMRYEYNGKLYSQKELYSFFGVTRKDLEFYTSYSAKMLWMQKPANREQRREARRGRQ